MELTEEMEKSVRSELDKIQGEIGPSFDTGEFSNKIIALVDYLHDSEKRLIIAIEKSQHLPPTVKVPESGRAEFGWLPYLFKHAKDTGSSDPLVKYLQEVLKRVFGKYESTLESLLRLLGILLDPQITREQWIYLEKNMGEHDIIAGDGTIVGDGKYEDLDKDWLYAPVWYLFNLVFPTDVARFTPPKPTAPFNSTIGSGLQSINIAIIGDWGTGKYESASGYDPATWVMQAVENLKPDYVIHLGDVYYAGTELRYPPGEEAYNFLDLWPNKFSGKSFTLNSNHEMYGGAQGYFNIALNRRDPRSSPFSVQKGFSYFALEFDPWVLVGLDAAYNDTSTLYMQGGIGTEKLFPVILS
ncbi:MAG: metallophosphoesterase [Candidatus Scalindua sp.]|nr:metallophosphoesterase [Candidatus Scalindua sp.]MDV5166436.1 metallophosphoesterase [Candidatus Scalindua sp.]